jgi:hypothetical protein
MTSQTSTSSLPPPAMPGLTFRQVTFSQETVPISQEFVRKGRPDSCYSGATSSVPRNLLFRPIPLPRLPQTRPPLPLPTMILNLPQVYPTGGPTNGPKEIGPPLPACRWFVRTGIPTRAPPRAFHQFQPSPSLPTLRTWTTSPPRPPLHLRSPSPLPVSPHKSLHSLTTSALSPTFSAPPLLHLPNVPLFPRSANSISSLPHQETMASTLHRTQILRRLARRDLTVSEERSIAHFTSRRTSPAQITVPPVKI